MPQSLPGRGRPRGARELCLSPPPPAHGLWLSPPLQEMSLAVITHCGHFFHGGCLRKWFYVQSTCPLCHQPVRLTAREDGRADPGIPQGAEAPRLDEAVAAAAAAAAPQADEEPVAGQAETADEPGGGKGRSSVAAGPAEEELGPEPAMGSGEPRALGRQSIPGRGSPWEELETIPRAGAGGHRLVRQGHPPAPASPTLLQAGGPAAPWERDPPAEFGLSPAPGIPVSRLPGALRHPVRGGGPAGLVAEGLQGPAPSRAGAESPGVAEGGGLGRTQPGGEASGGLEPAASSSDRAGDCERPPPSAPS